MAREELAVVLDFGWGTVFFPVFLDGADAVGADGDDFLDFILGQGSQVGLGELLEEEIVAEAADWVAGAFFFAKNAIARAQEVHDAGEVGDDLAALGVVGAHAAEPQTIFLGSVEEGELLALDELVAFGGADAEGVAAALEGEEEFCAVAR